MLLNYAKLMDERKEKEEKVCNIKQELCEAETQVELVKSLERTAWKTLEHEKFKEVAKLCGGKLVHYRESEDVSKQALCVYEDKSFLAGASKNINIAFAALIELGDKKILACGQNLKATIGCGELEWMFFDDEIINLDQRGRLIVTSERIYNKISPRDIGLNTGFSNNVKPGDLTRSYYQRRLERTYYNQSHFTEEMLVAMDDAIRLIWIRLHGEKQSDKKPFCVEIVEKTDGDVFLPKKRKRSE